MLTLSLVHWAWNIASARRSALSLLRRLVAHTLITLESPDVPLSASPSFSCSLTNLRAVLTPNPLGLSWISYGPSPTAVLPSSARKYTTRLKQDFAF